MNKSIVQITFIPLPLKIKFVDMVWVYIDRQICGPTPSVFRVTEV